MTDFPVLKPLVHCGNCGQDQSITNFRVLKQDPPLFTDFCGTCEAHFGTLTLYKKHAGTRWVNRTAHQWISAGADPDAHKLEKKAVDYREEQVREFARRELSRKYLLYYVKQFNPTYLIGWVHKDICRRLEQFVRDVEQGLSPRLMLFMPPRHGKLLAHSTPVVGPSGWTTHGKLAPGDFVYGVNGRPTKVLAVSDVDLAAYEVEFSNGAIIKAHANHEWTVYDRSYGAVRTYETQYFAGVTKFGKKKKVMSAGRSIYQLPQREALAFEEKQLLLHPYMLGVWLGDGQADGAQFCFAEKDRCILEAVNAVGYAQSWVSVHKNTGVNYAGFTGMQQQLKKLKVFGNKHIPRVYLHSSVEQRLELLAGLVDTDGHVERKTGRVRIATCSDQLRDDLLELVRGLGMEPYCFTQAPTLSTSGIQGKNPVHYIGFQPTLGIPTRVPRKKINRIRKPLAIGIVDVRPCAPEKGRCIQVAAADGLYLAGRELVPTHNSTLVSLELPGWVLGRHPEWEIISASYASSLPIGFSRTIKDRLDDADYHAIFPETQLRPDARGVEEWHTTKRGRYRAAGVEGGITGTGANIMIIDDPIKDYQEAQSPKVRENAYNWYTSTARSRMSPGGGVLIVMTRWHDGDLAGGLLSDKQALLEANVPIEELDDWQVVSYPAIAEYDEYLFPDRTVHTGPEHVPEGSILLRKKDDALHPERYSQLELRRIRNTMPSVQWNALYQQNPVPETGEYFTKDMFRTYTALPGAEDDYAYFMAWDLAIGEKSQNDWTVGTVCAYHWSGSIYILDMIRARMNVHGIINAMVSMGKKWPDIQVLGIEYGQIYKTMAPLINEAIQREKLKFSISEDLKPVTDKLMRARPLQQKMQTGLIHFPTAQPWVSLVERELLRFPSGTHDDIVDSLAWLIRMSMVISPPKPQKARAQGRKPDSWKKQLVAKSGAKSFMTA